MDAIINLAILDDFYDMVIVIEYDSTYFGKLESAIYSKIG